MVQYSETLINILSAFLILIIGLILAQILSNIIRKVIKGMEISKTLEDQLKIKFKLEKYLASIVKYILYLVTIILVLNKLGVSTRVLEIIFIIIIVAMIIFIILAFKDWLPNLISGFYIIKSQKLEKGDIIKVKGITGRVMQINLLETKIETNNNEIIFIPNHTITKYEVTKVKK